MDHDLDTRLPSLPPELGNPFHAALVSLHAPLAIRAGAVRRFPGDYAPFLGIDDGAADSDVDADLAALVAPGEAVYLIGPVPRTPQGWTRQAFRPLAQMVCTAPLVVPDGADLVALDAADRDEVLALTALVYPHYFRRRTMELGRYFGIRENGRLAAMAGERLGSANTREISAICTHPDFGGRGHARRLTAWLANDILGSGRTPFLHVSHENIRAKTLYEQLGFRRRCDIGFFALQRP